MLQGGGLAFPRKLCYNCRKRNGGIGMEEKVAAIIAALRERYPAARVLGHRDVATGGTTCPGKYFPFEEIAGGQAESREGDKIMVTTQMIGSGDRGNAVKSMQGALIAQGYPCGSYGRFRNGCIQSEKRRAVLATLQIKRNFSERA